MHGVVVEFDDDKGYGAIQDGAGTRYFFHCTEIHDGSRTIEAGTPVTFTIMAGHLGRYEASDLRRTSS